MSEKSLNFKVSTHLKDIIGKDLVTDKYVAIFELVKNSVDAKAKNIDIFISKNQIIISDDGYGMTLKDIENRWFFIGYSEKKEASGDYAGSKGIGRFSADNLAKKLLIKTKSLDESTVSINVDWEKFEKNQKEKIDSISIPYEEISDYNSTGTVLVMSELRSQWAEEDIIKLKSSLEKIENPFEEGKGLRINLKSDYPDLNGLISNSLRDVLNEKSIYLHVSIKESKFFCELKHNNKLVVRFQYEQECILEDVTFNIYHLSQAAKVNFTRKMGVRFINYGNIFIYRNGFRVYPYGETNYDTFQLNIRKTQGYNRYLGLRDIIGSISIKDSDKRFKEVSSRDNGFVTNSSYLELKDVYMEYHRFLEDFMQISLFNATMNYQINEDIIKRFIKKNHFSFEFGRLEKYIEYKDVIKKIDRDIPLSVDEKKVLKDEKKKNEKEILEVKDIRKENTQLHKEKAELKKEIEIKNIIINSNVGENIYSKEMFNHHVNSQVNELKSIIKSFKRSNPDVTGRESYTEFEQNYFEIIHKLRAIKGIVFNVNEKITGNSKNNIVHFIKEYSIGWSKKNKLNVNVYTNEIDFVVDYDIINLVIVLDNLFENADKGNANKVDVIFEKVKNRLIIQVISRNSIIEKMDLEKVFDFGYSTSKRGTGMGMFFVKKIVEEHFKGSVKAEVLNNKDFVTKIEMG